MDCKGASEYEEDRGFEETAVLFRPVFVGFGMEGRHRWLIRLVIFVALVLHKRRVVFRSSVF